MGKYHCQNCHQWVDERCHASVSTAFYYTTALSIRKVYFTGKIVNGKLYGKGTLTLAKTSYIGGPLFMEEYKGDFQGDFLEGTCKNWYADEESDKELEDEGRISLKHLEFVDPDPEWEIFECAEIRMERQKNNG